MSSNIMSYHNCYGKINFGDGDANVEHLVIMIMLINLRWRYPHNKHIYDNLFLFVIVAVMMQDLFQLVLAVYQHWYLWLCTIISWQVMQDYTNTMTVKLDLYIVMCWYHLLISKYAVLIMIQDPFQLLSVVYQLWQIWIWALISWQVKYMICAQWLCKYDDNTYMMIIYMYMKIEKW